MQDKFTSDDWEYVRHQADLMASRLRAKGLRTSGIKPLPPVNEQQVHEFYQATGRHLPTEFINLLTKFAGGWTFQWSLSTEEWGFDVHYAPAECGCGEVFIGVTERDTILSEYMAFQNRIPEESRTEATPFLFPLNPDGSGDYLVLRFDCSPAQVIALDHEMGYALSMARVLSHGFVEFIRAWATVGFPAWEYMKNWMPEGSEQLNDSDDQSKKWIAWLADPTARSSYEE